eukprot:gene17182-23674_t
MSSKNDERNVSLFDVLQNNIRNQSLTELHTHIYGMGSAEFWVKTIIENFLIRIKINTDREVLYTIKDLLKADGHIFEEPKEETPNIIPHRTQLKISRLESRLFGTLKHRSNNSHFDEFNAQNILERYLSNTRLVDFLSTPGEFTSIVSNWFQFLSRDDHKYRGNFHPEFYPARFVMKDAIMKVYPEVAAILMNSTNHNYAEAGVNYIEYSVSVGDIIEFQYNEEYNPANISISKFGAMMIRSEGGAKSLNSEIFSSSANDTTPLIPTDAMNNKESLITYTDNDVNVTQKSVNSQVQTELNSHLDWRQFVNNYYDEPCGQRYYFLAGFS